MISGMYLGELGRRIIERCASEGLMFGGRVSPELATPNKYDTKYISDVERYKLKHINEIKTRSEDFKYDTHYFLISISFQ